MKIIDRITNKFWRSLYIPKTTIKQNNSHFKVPRLVPNNFYTSSYESEGWLTRVIDKINQSNPINTFIDVGANIGQTLLKVKAINVHISYVGFEPNPFCVAVLQHIIALNSLEKCQIIPCGLSDKTSLITLEIGEKTNLTDSSASLIPGFRDKESEYSQYVPVFTLDDQVPNLPGIDTIELLKIDVEGAELEAIKGMTETLKKFSPIVIIEVLPSYTKTNTFRLDRQNELSNILHTLGYSIFQILGKEEVITLQKVNSFPIHDNLNQSDYILLPKKINEKTLGFKTA